MISQADIQAARKKRTPWAIVERRKEFLKLKAASIGMSAIVAQLAIKYGVKESTIWKDWQNRDEWRKNYQTMMKSAEEIHTWFNELADFTEESLKELVLTADNSNAKVGAAKNLMDLGFRRMELSQSMGVTARVPTGLEVSGRMVTEIVDKSTVWLDALTEEMPPDEIKVLLKNVARAKSAAENQ